MIVLTAKITLESGEEILINRNNLLSIESEILDRGETKQPTWGIKSNSGRMQFLDYRDTDGNLVVKSLAENKKLTSKAKVEIFLKDTLTKKESSLCEFLASEWSYDVNGFTVGLQFKDDLEEWQDIYYELIDVSQNTNAYAIYTELKKTCEDLGWKFSKPDSSTTLILTSHSIRFLFLNNSSIWRQWEKLCEACGLVVFKNRLGEINVSYIFRSF